MAECPNEVTASKRASGLASNLVHAILIIIIIIFRESTLNHSTSSGSDVIICDQTFANLDV